MPRPRRCPLPRGPSTRRCRPSRHGSHREAKRHLAALGEEREDVHELSRSEFFSRPLPAAEVAALVRRFAAARIPGEARELDFTPWGGAYGDVAPAATASSIARAEETPVIAPVKPCSRKARPKEAPISPVPMMVTCRMFRWSVPPPAR